MRKKAFVALLLVLVFLLGTLPAFADSPDLAGITTFGGSDLRDRSSGATSLEFWTAWKSDFGQNPGTSYSQPLIVYDPNSTQQNNIYVIAAGGGTSPEIAIWKDLQASSTVDWQNNPPVWSATLPGSLATMSHPSLYEMNGHDILFIGTNNASGGAHLIAWDITNLIEGTGDSSETPILDVANPVASDIVSAPLLEYWQDQQGVKHPVVIYSDGNSSRVEVAYNIDNLASGQDATGAEFEDIPVGSGGGRTSSSPAPVMNGTGFVIGWDDGGSDGGIYVYRLDDIFTTAGDGSMTVKNNVQPYDTGPTDAGVDQSFSVDPNNTNVIYFGDSRADIHGYDTSTGTWLWPANQDIPDKYGYPDDFSNRSPALDGTNILFPFGTGTSTDFGGVIAVNKSTGQTSWISNGGQSLVGYDQYGMPFENGTNAQTAPVVANTNHPSGEMILEGLGDGQIVALDPSNGQEYDLTGPMTSVAQEINSYAKGITGEISLYGNYAAVTYDNGVMVFSLLPSDLAVTKLSIYDGSQALQPDSSGTYTVKAGQTYTVKADYAYLVSPSGDSTDNTWDLPQVPVGGFHGIGGTWNSQSNTATGSTWYSFQSLTDQNGQALQQASLTSEYSETPQQEFYVGLQHQGSTGEVDWQWTPATSDAGSSNFIGVALNESFSASNPLIQMYPDQPLTNNAIQIPVTIEAPQLVVTPAVQSIQVGQTAPFISTYYPLGQANQNQPGGAGQVVTTQSTWSNSSGIASFTSPGQDVGGSPGETTVTASYNGATGQAQLTIEQPYQAPASTGGLKFDAVSQKWYSNLNVGGDGQYHQETRPENTAKWMDTVTASLTPLAQYWGTLYSGGGQPDYSTTVAPPPPPPPSGQGAPPNSTQMTRWVFTGATLTYPAQASGYTFGAPLPPEGTNSVAMSTGSTTSKGSFQETWSEDGVNNGQGILSYGQPAAQGTYNSQYDAYGTSYGVTASSISVQVTYTETTYYWVSTPPAGGYWASTTQTLTRPQSLNPITGQLFVDGAGAFALGTGSY